HLIAPVFWNYINRADISPDGWMKDFGAPLTEPLTCTITKNGSPHHLLVQAFARNGLLLDQDAAVQPAVQQIPTGIDYLRTLGPPTVVIGTQQTVWVQSTTSLLKTPATGQALAHVGRNFPLKLLENSNWVAGMLWYHIQWVAPKSSNSGWVSATA